MISIERKQHIEISLTDSVVLAVSMSVGSLHSSDLPLEQSQRQRDSRLDRGKRRTYFLLVLPLKKVEAKYNLVAS